MTDTVSAGRQARQQGVEFAPRRRIGLALAGDRQAADGLDARENRLAFLLAHGIAENLAEQPDVLVKRALHFRHSVPRWTFRSSRSSPQSLSSLLTRSDPGVAPLKNSSIRARVEGVVSAGKASSG